MIKLNKFLLDTIYLASLGPLKNTGNKVLEVQILEPQSPALYIVIVLSCPLIGSRSSSTANQRAAQNNCRALGSQDLYFLKFFTCKELILAEFKCECKWLKKVLGL